MTFALAAAGTGGHVFPALAVAEALCDEGVDRDDVYFFGGERFAGTAVPEAGFELVRLPLQGLQRRVTTQNLRIPFVVRQARRLARHALRVRRTQVVLCAGGYVTVPVALAARSEGVPYFLAEQNAHAGLANRLMARGAEGVFTAFPVTAGLAGGEHVGNPVRRTLAHFSRPALRAEALQRYDFLPNRVTLGVVGGSLGAAVLNEAVAALVARWDGPDLQIVHLVGERNHEEYSRRAGGSDIPQSVVWRVVPFETDMHYFFAASDFVLSRAGGMVAELTATGTPAVLVPGGFGSRGHQEASAEYLVAQGAAVMVDEEDQDAIVAAVSGLAADSARRRHMAEASQRTGRPAAARVIAQRLIDAHG